MRLIAFFLCMTLSIGAHAQTPACNRITFALQSLRVTTLTTGSTAYQIFNAGDVVCGGFVTSDSGGFCVNQKGTAGTSTSGDTQCVPVSTPYYLAPSAGAVSASSLTSSIVLGGLGFH